MAATYTPIATTTLGADAASYTFSSIPSTYTDLVVICNVTCASAHTAYAQYNSDTGSNYSSTQLYGTGSGSAASYRVSSQTSALAGISDGTSVMKGNIMNYANTNTYKTILHRYSDVTSGDVEAGVNLWRSTSAINIMTISLGSGTFISGSKFTLYGILAA